MTFFRKPLTKQKLSFEELAAFCTQISIFLASGISLTEGITLMMEDTANEEEKRILEEIIEQQQLGTFAQALESTNLFPSYLLQMVTIGEETGKLDEVMAALSRHYQKEESIRTGIRQAILYPAVMTGMMLVVILVLVIKVIPLFNQVFIQLGTEMTGFSGILADFGTALQKHPLLPVLFLLLLLSICLYPAVSNNGKRLLQKCYRHFSYTRHISEKIAACRFAGGMALTLSSGLNPELAMKLVCQLNTDPDFEKKLNICRDALTAREDFSQALVQSGIFTGMYARLVSIGAKSGTLDQVMEQIAHSYQEEIDTSMSRLLAMIEPTLVILLSLVVGSVLMSVMFPLLGMMSAM